MRSSCLWEETVSGRFVKKAGLLIHSFCTLVWRTSSCSTVSFGGILPSVHPAHKMVVVPSCESRDLLLADRANPFLLFPEGKQLSFPLEIVYHFDVEAFFNVLFPGGILGVCLSFDFHMSLDRDICRVEETASF